MKKSFMSNIRNFVDSNVRQRIDRVAHNNSEFFSGELLSVERQFEDLRYICTETEKRISNLLQSTHTSSIGSYTQNVQAGINNLSQLTSSSGSSTNTTTNKQNESYGFNNFQACSGQIVGSKSQQTVSTSLSSSSRTSTPTVAGFVPRNDISSNTPNESQECSQNIDSVRTFTNEISNGMQQKYKKLPIVGFLKFLLKSSNKLRSSSPLAITLNHCSQLQSQMTELYLSFEQQIEIQCLKPLRQILENDIPNVAKLRKSFIKSHNDLESAQAKYNVVCHKQQQQQLQQQQQAQSSHSTSNSYTIVPTNSNNSQLSGINKLDQLKKELDEALTRFEQAKDIYETELYAFICRETEIADLITKFYSYHSEYHQQVCRTIQFSLPTLDSALAVSHRKAVFGIPLEEHLRCTGRAISPVIELCIHLLYLNGLNEEGLFRISGSSVKIKKLKNAINAWSITLATSCHDGEHRSQNQDTNGQSSVIAIYDLFRTIVVKQEPSLQQQSSLEISANLQSVTMMPTTRYDQTLNQSNMTTATTTLTTPTTTTTTLNNNTTNSVVNEDSLDIATDVHTVAGLLKLYLRELPEPLLTYAHYNQWLEAIRKPLTSDDRLERLSKIIQQLPQSNQNNLKHLIRFLNLLNSHKESNKMSSSNLAIAIAPSLIWSQPQVTESNSDSSEQAQGVASTKNTSGNNNNTNCTGTHDTSAQAFSMQMSSFGMSASLHALILESLINHAQKLFPGPVDFTMSEFKGLLRIGSQRNDCDSLVLYHQSRLKAKSTSPTGLSTASSSSFSSGSSSVTTSAAGVSQQHVQQQVATTKTMSHSLKGGSMDGSLNQTETSTPQPQQQMQPTHKQPPPPVPPMPVNRSNLSNNQPQQEISTNTPTSQHHRHKPLAPPVPPPISGSRSLRARPCSIAVSAGESISQKVGFKTATTFNESNVKSPRNTGNPLPSPVHANATRPTVPPPERPQRTNALTPDLTKGSNSSTLGKSDESLDKCKTSGNVNEATLSAEDEAHRWRPSNTNGSTSSALKPRLFNESSQKITPIVSSDTSNDDESSFDRL